MPVSIRSFGDIADAGQFKETLNLLAAADEGDRAELEQAAFAISQRAGSDQSGYVLEAMAAAKEPAVKSSLLSVLGKMSNDKTLNNVYAALKTGMKMCRLPRCVRFRNGKHAVRNWNS